MAQSDELAKLNRELRQYKLNEMPKLMRLFRQACRALGEWDELEEAALEQEEQPSQEVCQLRREIAAAHRRAQELERSLHKRGMEIADLAKRLRELEHCYNQHYHAVGELRSTSTPDTTVREGG